MCLASLQTAYPQYLKNKGHQKFKREKRENGLNQVDNWLITEKVK